jgi:hypothetical protein
LNGHSRCTGVHGRAQHVGEGSNNPLGITFNRRTEGIDGGFKSVVGDRFDRSDDGGAEQSFNEWFDHELRAISGHRHSRVARSAL